MQRGNKCNPPVMGNANGEMRILVKEGFCKKHCVTISICVYGIFQTIRNIHAHDSIRDFLAFRLQIFIRYFRIGINEWVVPDFSCQPLYLLRHPIIILVTKCNPFSLSKSATFLKIFDVADILFILMYLHVGMRLRVFFQQCKCAVSAFVINDDQFNIGIRLGKNGI